MQYYEGLKRVSDTALGNIYPCYGYFNMQYYEGLKRASDTALGNIYPCYGHLNMQLL